MLEEGVVLARHEGEHDVLRDLLHLHQLPSSLEELTNGASFAIQHTRGKRGPVVLERAEVGQVSQERQIDGAHREDAPHAENHREPHQDSYPPGRQ